MNTQLPLSWTAYTSEHLDTVYDRHAASLGHRPSFTVTYGGDHAVVHTTEPDAARAIIAEVERLVANA